LIAVPKANTTSIMLPVALFLSLFITLDWKEIDRNSSVSNACLIALISAATCSLKYSLIPASVIVFAVSYIGYFISSNTKLKVVENSG